MVKRKTACSRSDRAFRGIVKMAKSIQKLAGQAVTEYKMEVDAIIASRCQDRRLIERTLDGMLDLCFDGKMLELYRKFCRYYYGIDPSAAVEYVHFYRDMWEPEKKKQSIAGQRIR